MNKNAHPIEILLVEDNPLDAELALSALKEHKITHKVEHVKDGPEAIEFMFSQGKYEGSDKCCLKIVLLDLKLPKLNGLEVLRILKSDERTKKIPVIMLTSSKEEPDIEQAYSLGANSYIVKPVEFDKFVDALKNIGFYWMLINQAPQKNYRSS